MERCIGRIKQNRTMATTYDKRTVRHQTTTHIASINHWLKRPT